MSDQQGEPGGSAAGRGAGATGLSRQGPLAGLIGKIGAKPLYGLAALALVGIGVAVGVSIPSSSATPAVEQGTVTWVNEGAPATWAYKGQPVTAGSPVEFLARLDGARHAQVFGLASDFEWTTAGNAGWTEGSPTGSVPPCMVPMVHGRLAPGGIGHVRARIRFGVVPQPMPDGATFDVAIWVQCP